MARKSKRYIDSTEAENKSSKPRSFSAGVYLRLSLEDEKEESIWGQEYVCREYISQSTDIVLYEIYADNGFSSFSANRPAFQRMINDIDSKKIDCVIVRAVSRFGRDYLETCEYVEQIFPSKGVRFISILDQYDSISGDPADLGIILKSLMSYYYSIGLSQNMKSVIKLKQEHGEYMPSRLPFGYIKQVEEHKTKWKIDEYAAGIVKLIYDMYFNGTNPYSIAGELNSNGILSPKNSKWSAKAVERILQNRAYIGEMATGKTRNEILHRQITQPVKQEDWIIHENHHPAIMDIEKFEIVQLRLSSRSDGNPKYDSQTDDFFCGKVFCGLCGRKMKRKSSKGKNGQLFGYICSGREESKEGCSNKYISELKLKATIFKLIIEKIDVARRSRATALAYEKSLRYFMKEEARTNKLDLLKDEISRYDNISVNAFEKYFDNDKKVEELFEYYRMMRESLQDEIASIEKTSNDYWANHSSKTEYILRFLRYEDNDEIISGMIETLIRRIEIEGDEVTIDFVL